MNLFDIPEQLPEQELTEILLTGKHASNALFPTDRHPAGMTRPKMNGYASCRASGN